MNYEGLNTTNDDILLLHNVFVFNPLLKESLIQKNEIKLKMIFHFLGEVAGSFGHSIKNIK